MHAQMTVLNFNWISFIKMAKENFALLCSKSVVSTLRIDLACLDHCGILIYL